MARLMDQPVPQYTYQPVLPAPGHEHAQAIPDISDSEAATAPAVPP
eukprot:gene2282-4282_t